MDQFEKLKWMAELEHEETGNMLKAVMNKDKCETIF